MRPPPGDGHATKFPRLKNNQSRSQAARSRVVENLQCELNTMEFRKMRFDLCVFTVLVSQPVVVAIYVSDLLVGNADHI